MGKKGHVQEVSEGGREGERGTVRVRNWVEKREGSLSEDGAVGQNVARYWMEGLKSGSDVRQRGGVVEMQTRIVLAEKKSVGRELNWRREGWVLLQEEVLSGGRIRVVWSREGETKKESGGRRSGVGVRDMVVVMLKGDARAR